MVSLAQMMAAQKGAQPTTPTVENKEELHGQTDRNINSANNEEGVESGTVGAETQRAAEPDRNDSAPKGLGGLAGLRLNAGSPVAGTGDSSSRGGVAHAAGVSEAPEQNVVAYATPSANSDGAGGGADSGRSAGGAGLLSGLKLSASPPPAPSPSGAVAPKAATTGPGDSLASLSADESSGIPSIISASGYADEIPATAPARELPADMTPQMEAFVKSLNNIYLVMDDPELFAQMIRSIMMDLQSNPAYSKLIADDDVMVMIRGMRESMGLAKMRKESKKRATSTDSKKKAAKSDAMFDTLAALAGDMGMEIE